MGSHSSGLRNMPLDHQRNEAGSRHSGCRFGWSWALGLRSLLKQTLSDPRAESRSPRAEDLQSPKFPELSTSQLRNLLRTQPSFTWRLRARVRVLNLSGSWFSFRAIFASQFTRFDFPCNQGMRSSVFTS